MSGFAYQPQMSHFGKKTFGTFVQVKENEASVYY